MSLVIDVTRFPATAAYLTPLPQGAASFPSHLAKASLYRKALEEHPLRDVRGALPAELVTLIEEPAPPSSWIPQAAWRGVMRAIYDEHFRDERRYRAWIYRSNRSMFDSTMYGILMRVISPAVLLRGAQMRWETFHRGIPLRVVRATDGEALLTLTFPAPLLDAFDLRVHVEAFRAAIDAAGGRDIAMDVNLVSPGHAEFRARWR